MIKSIFVGEGKIRIKDMKKLFAIDSYQFLYITIGLMSAIVFCSIYGVHVLNPTYTDWLLEGADLSQHYLGWEAYRYSSWHFPLGMVDTLAYPNITSVIFTDSIPLFALIFKVLSPILPGSFQYFGFWGILCFVLQAVLAARIIKNFTSNKVVIAILGILFVYTPVMIFRMYVHTALAGQWIILLGLEPIFAHKKYQDNKKIYIVAALMGLFSSSIHIYFILISGIILIGICLVDMTVYKRVKRSILLLLTYLSVAAAVVGLFGGFSSGMQAENGGLGVYSFNLNAFFNPQDWSVIFQTLPLYGDGQYEGFAYLGAGAILLFLAAIISFAACTKVKLYIKNHWQELTSLAIVSMISIVIALSPIVTIGDRKLFQVPLPGKVITCWSIFRASGRMVWVAVYIIMLCSCVVLARLLNKRTLVTVVSVVLILQVYDIHKILDNKRENFNQVKVYDSVLKTEEFWGKIAETEQIKHVVYFTSVAVDYTVLYSITDWALNNGMTVNDFYFARTISDKVSASRSESLATLSEQDVFILKPDDVAYCLNNYDLNYYEIDGLVVGYVKEIEGFTPVNSSNYP